jgi:hypothetical protein
MAAAEAGQAMLGAGGGSVPKPSAIKDPMVVMHNIHEIPLMKAYERGGIPVPSLAVVKADEPLQGFGELSLIGSPSMAKPSARNPVYKTDAYTARQPRIDIVPDRQAIKYAENEFIIPFGRFAEGANEKDIAEHLLMGEEGSYGSVLLKAKYLQEKGKLPLDSFENATQFRQYVRNTIDEGEQFGYSNWLQDQPAKIREAGGGANERIFLGFTPSGNRKYASANLANLVKEMKGKGAGSEGLKGTFGSLRGTIADKFKTEKEVRESRGLLGKDENFEETQAEVSQIYYELLSDIGEQTGLRSDGAVDVLEYLILGGNKQLRDFADSHARSLSENTVAKIPDFVSRVKSMPTEYFEVKPQRGVGIGEFKGAIVPSNVREETLDALRDSGITNIKQYKTQEERARLVKEFGDQFFTLPSTPVPMSGLLGEEKMTGDEMLRAGII